MEKAIVIPSHKRAGRVSTLDIVAGCVLCVPEAQAAAYRTAHPAAEVVTHPDGVNGIMAKRQWMLDRWAEVALVMLDDDIVSMRRMYRPPLVGYPRKSTIAPDLAREIIERTAETAAEMGSKLFGWASHCNPQTYQPLKPFGHGGYCCGGAMGFLPGHNLHFPADVMLPGCDYWVCALNAYHNRFAFYDRRFGFEFRSTYDNPGGMSEFRGPDGEAAGLAWLKVQFGDAIKEPNKTPWTKAKKNAGGRSLKVPWHV